MADKKPDFSNVRSGSDSTAPAPAATGSSTYTVEKGDSLWKIAKRFYGNGSEWTRIHEANRDLIADPDLIQPGWILTIPEKKESES